MASSFQNHGWTKQTTACACTCTLPAHHCAGNTTSIYYKFDIPVCVKGKDNYDVSRSKHQVIVVLCLAVCLMAPAKQTTACACTCTLAPHYCAGNYDVSRSKYQAIVVFCLAVRLSAPPVQYVAQCAHAQDLLRKESTFFHWEIKVNKDFTLMLFILLELKNS